MDLSAELKRLRDEQNRLSADTRASTTAIGGGTPSSQDLYRETQMRDLQKRINSLQNQHLRDRWYSPERQPGREGSDAGMIGRTVNVLSQPLYGVVGALGHAMGKGKGDTLAESVTRNMREDRDTFSNILSRKGAPYGVSAPLGFALDVMFDPINWVSVGTAALIPRIAQGAIRGGVTGAVKGAQSNLLKKAAITVDVGSRAIPFKGAAIRDSAWAKSLNAKSLKTGDAYNKLVGFDPVANAMANKGTVVSGFRMSLREMAEDLAGKVPGGTEWLRKIDYNNADHMRVARIKDELMDIMGGSREAEKESIRILKEMSQNPDGFSPSLMRAQEAFFEGRRIDPTELAKKKGSVLDELSIEGPDVFPDTPGGYFKGREKMAPKAREIIDELKDGDVGRIAEDMSDIVLGDKKLYRTLDPTEASLRTAMERTNSVITESDLRKIFDSGLLDDTGIKTYDKFVKMVRGWEIGLKSPGAEERILKVGDKMLNAYSTFIQGFKRAKVGGSPSAWTNAILGNPTMAWMAGINIADPLFLREVGNATKVMANTRGSVDVIRDLLANPQMAKAFLRGGEREFARTTGISPDFMRLKVQTFDEMSVRARDAGIPFPVRRDEQEEFLNAVVARFEDVAVEMSGGPGTAVDAVGIGRGMGRSPLDAPPTPGVMAKEMVLSNAAATGGVTRYDLPSSIAADFYSSREAEKIFNVIAERAKSGDVGYKFLDLFFNRLVRGYEKIDQTYKLGTISYVTKHGLTETELQRVSRILPLKAGDIVEGAAIAGQRRFLLSGEKAQILANEIFLNYAAMPAAVRMLRNMPIFGFPFASFTMGMTHKTLQTLVHNPAAFTRIHHFMQDFGGEKSPMERHALQGKYYGHFNEPGMMRIPFFKQNPVYINLANLIPYYSLNMFMHSERPYENTVPGRFIELIDKSPILKDPVGQVMLDYLIIPLILRDSQKALGFFGQPIYPENVTVLEALGLMTRSAADAVVPGALAPVGLAVPSDYAHLLPGFRMRQLSQAKAGKNILGIAGKEPATSRVMRTLAGTVGFPVQAPMDLSYTETEIKRDNP